MVGQTSLVPMAVNGTNEHDPDLTILQEHCLLKQEHPGI